jgi:hypothetical protein
MEAMINIGLMRNVEPYGFVRIAEIEKQLEHWDITVLQSRVAIVDDLQDEDTYVARVDAYASEDALYAISVALDQDCIAIRYADGQGKLIGPKAKEWGEFNPAFFKELEDCNV